jgi:hypothetical protein
VTTNVSADRVPIPAQLGDLTAGWFSQALDCKVSAVEVIDAHSGTTAAMGSKWQPIEIARPAMIRATESVEDLDAVGLLEERFGLR